MFKLANVFYYYIHIMPIYEIYLSNQQKTRLSNFLSFRFVWDTPFCQKTAEVLDYQVLIFVERRPIYILLLKIKMETQKFQWFYIILHIILTFGQKFAKKFFICSKIWKKFRESSVCLPVRRRLHGGREVVTRYWATG